MPRNVKFALRDPGASRKEKRSGTLPAPFDRHPAVAYIGYMRIQALPLMPPPVTGAWLFTVTD